MFAVLISVLAILGSSALLSMSEAAILSLPLVRVRVLFEQKKRHAKALLAIKEDITYTIATIVILNNTINIIGSIFVGQLVAHLFGDEWLGIVSGVLTFGIVVVGEIIPKVIGERYKATISLLAARPVRILTVVLHPLVWTIMKMTHPFTRSDDRIPKISEDEIKMMLRIGHAEGSVEMDEAVLCQRVFKLNDVRAFQIMKPINQIYALPADKTLTELKEEIINAPYSRIAVFQKDPVDIVGTVQQSALLREIARDNYQANVGDFMVPPVFVNYLTKADSLLEKFQASKQHLFIVQDTAGRDMGIVTLEDVLEELFGEIYDEKDALKHQKALSTRLR